jgi:hypothetical protein
MFKRGSQYTRSEIANLVRPDNPPNGGDWTTGYARIENNLYVFMNMGVPGRTGHDFENYYDEKTNTLIWFSKPGKHSTNPLFQKLFSGELTPYFFARWNQNPPFTFLGTGSIIKFEDGYDTPQGHKCIRLVVSVTELKAIISPHQEIVAIEDDSVLETERSSFFFEKQLEDFLVSNWDRTPLAKEYEIFEENGQKCGQQYRTHTGPIDILGQKRDKSDFLVIELKRDRASDVVVGQTLRYMGWVKEHLCTSSQNVTGCIIAQRKDEKLDYALKHVDSIRFLKYEVDFRLLS